MNDLVLVRATDLLARIPRPPGPGARLIARFLTQAGLRPLAVRLGADPVAVVEPSAPELRATAIALTHKRFNLQFPVLTPAEFVLWGTGKSARSADWGELPTAPTDSSVRRTLRGASGLLWHELPSALGAIGRRPQAREQGVETALRIRQLLERVAPPSSFPALPGLDARARELQRTAMGAAHVAFSTHRLEEPGPSLEDGVPQAEARTAQSVRRLFQPLLADLGGPTREAIRSLSLLPGSVGTRHAWTLVALVDDDTPLHVAAAVRDALQGHLSMLAGVRTALAPRAPVVLTHGTLRSMLGGRLFRFPLRRLAMRLHRIVLIGDDPTLELPGLDASDDDRRGEVAALIGATARVSGGRSVDVEDLIFGAWPAAIHHATYGDPTASQRQILNALSERTDPALSRVGSAAERRAWGDPAACDRGRPGPVLRDWGPTLVRLQEVAVESLR
jgi:hypothetical protein